MKTKSLFLALILLSINGFTQEWVSLGSTKAVAPKVSLLSSTDEETTVRFSLAGFHKTELDTPRGQQLAITVPKMAALLEEAAPDLPLFSIPVIIGDRDEMEVKIEEARFEEFDNIEIAPSKGNLSRETDPATMPFRYGEIYSQDQFFPVTQAELDAPYILRDFRGQNILVYPFSYNPIKKTLRVYTELTLTLHKISEKGKNPKAQRKSNTLKMSPEAKAMYAQRFVNFTESSSKYPFLPDEGEMLVICPEPYLQAMQPFVDWKNQSGRPTTMVSLAEAGGNNADQLKSFILSHYNNPSENLTYLLLVGDYADITPKAMNGGRSDIWFGQLEGNDYYPEIFVGRFSVESEADVETHVAKVLYYERDMDSEADWLNKGIGIGANEGSGTGHNDGEADYQHIEYIRDTLLHYTYAEVSQHYAGIGVGTNAAMLSENFNAGASICNYCNHGTTNGWSVGSFTSSHVNALVNDNKWPFIWSTACLNGKFDVDCFAEAWMRATNTATGIPTGAIGGMFSWTSQPWQPPMTGQDEMVNVLCEWRNADQYHHTFGGASFNGNMKILDLHPTDQGTTHNTWILFGDPSLLLRTDNPEVMNVSCEPPAIFLEQTELHLTTDVDYAVATLSRDGYVLCSVPIIGGEGTLAFEPQHETGTAQLVVTSYNRVTYIQNIEIIPANGAYVAFDSFSINNASGQADYGETFSIDLTLKNLGNEAASNVQVKLGSESPFIDILEDSAILPSLDEMGHYTIENSFLIKVAPHVTDGTQAMFTVTCTEGSNIWNSSFRMTLHAPVFALTDFRPEANIYPSESGNLLISIKNIGSAKAHNTRLELYSSSTDIVFGETTHAIGDIPAGETAAIIAPLSTAASVSIGSCFEIFYFVKADSYLLDGIEMLNIGALKETFETGDFNAFNWTTLGGALWQIDNSTSNTGTYSARSGTITHANLSVMQIDMDVTTDGLISFFKKTSTEANKDKFTFYIDSHVMGEWSGEVDWSRESFPVTAGHHIFKWFYMKDSNGSYGDDCCWIDDIQFPATQVNTFLPGIEVEAEVSQNQVTLSWQATNPNDSYIIRCEGQQLAIQQETSFTETRADGIYLYSVTVLNGLQMSAPNFVLVQTGVTDISENQQNISVYPNPTADKLYINLDESYRYTLYDISGKEMLNGADKILNLNHLPKGLYLLSIVTKERVCIQKIIKM